MYTVDGLLRAIDTVIASAENRLTERELELLVKIRAGIAENKSMELVEANFMWLCNFLLPIIDYIER